MNIVIIVGHPASGFEEVESRLQQCGMKAALPSRREGVLPKDISNALCIAHQAPAPETVTSESGFRQIEAGVVWHGMALDLLLGNLEQELWGWSDTRCIFLLDYWRMLDPKITFVLVYDEPQRAIAEAALHESGELDEKEIQRLLANWAAYNGAMLGFFLRNPERCLLVHAQQVHRSLEDHLTQLRSRLNAPPEVASAVLRDHGITGADVAIAPTTRSMTGPLTQALHDALALICEQSTNALDAFHSDPAERFIIQGVISGYPECLQLYEELQSAANLPLNAGDADAAEHGTAWKALIAQRQFIAQILGELHRKYQNLEEQSRNTSLEHHLLQEQFLELRGELTSAVTQNLEQTAMLRNFQQTERQAAEYRLKIRELQVQIEGRSEDQALTQGLLRQIQNELENSNSENLSLRQSCERHVVEHKVAMDAVLQSLQHAESLAEERQLKIRELQVQIEGCTEDQAVTQGLLRQIQNELENSHTENLSLSERFERQVAVHKVAMDAVLQSLQHAESLAEERQLKIRELQAQSEVNAEDQAVTQGLLRQIQNALETSHTENLSLTERFERQVAVHKLAIDAILLNLQHVERLADERRLEIEELQAQTGTSAEDLAVTQGLLRQVQTELETSFTENLSLRQSCEHQVAEHKVAVDALLQQLAQVEQDLELCRNAKGTMETEHRLAVEDFQGKIALLVKETEQHTKDLSSGLADAKSAERLKQQLSYRLGSSIVSRSRSLGGWLSMPFAISRTIRDFNKSRKSKNG